MNNIRDWITAVGTFLSAVIAILVVLYTELKHKFNKASFRVNESIINPRTGYQSLIGNIPEERDGFIEVKFEIEQVSGTASRVEIVLKNIFRYNEGKREKWPYFIPSNLTWGNPKNKKIHQAFSTGVSRFCNLGSYGLDKEGNYIFKLATDEELGDSYTDLLSEELPQGKYELELIITGDNVNLLTSNFLLEVLGGWRSDDFKSFEKCINLKKM